MINPYSPGARRKVALAKTGTPAPGNVRVPAARIGRSGNILQSQTEALIGSGGDFNAGNKRELMEAISVLARYTDDKTVSVAHDTPKELLDRRRQALAEAMADADAHGTHSKPFLALGEVIGDEIWQTLGREGFARKTMLLKPLGKGETGRLRVRKKDVVAFFVSSNPNVVHSQVRQNYVYPPEFYLLANILIEDKEIEQASGDILDDKYQDGLEQILVAEDNVWLRLARTAATASNDPFFFNTFTPTVLSEMQTQVARWGIPVVTAIMAFDLWNDIRADAEFSSFFDPVSKHEIVLEGSLGSIFGTQLITDAYRHETLRVLADGEIFVLGAPQTLGGITVRKDLATKSIDHYPLGKPERGWFMEQIEGMSIVNSRALTRGQRI